MSAPEQRLGVVVGEMRECLQAAPHEKFPAAQVRGWHELLASVHEDLMQTPAPERRMQTPAAAWRENGEPDPHGSRYDCERAKLAGGHLTDDQVANAVYLDPSIVNLTVAKDRIRWLSRALLSATQAPPGGWSGWAIQYDGKMPKLFGAREIAELNWYPSEGAALIRLVEVERIPATPGGGAA